MKPPPSPVVVVPSSIPVAEPRQPDKWDLFDRDLAECARCGEAFINIRHTVDRENAPEGWDYFADVPFCRFLFSGRLTEGASGVSGYVQPWKRRRNELARKRRLAKKGLGLSA